MCSLLQEQEDMWHVVGFRSTCWKCLQFQFVWVLCSTPQVHREPHWSNARQIPKISCLPPRSRFLDCTWKPCWQQNLSKLRQIRLDKTWSLSRSRSSPGASRRCCQAWDLRCRSNLCLSSGGTWKSSEMFRKYSGHQKHATGIRLLVTIKFVRENTHFNEELPHSRFIPWLPYMSVTDVRYPLVSGQSSNFNQSVRVAPLESQVCGMKMQASERSPRTTIRLEARSVCTP